ncbi:MAG: sigma-70 family RNA polymerase sigma factor [Planctomycetes bacterium]|nr:sigma-70 family RNA polymerase sigma factor [Planctomycetota bacterium]
MDEQPTFPAGAAWFPEVVRHFERPLTRYALSLTGDVERARDAVQETFLELVRSASKVDRARPAPWLFTVCRSRAIDLARKEKFMKATDVADLAERPSAAPAPEAAAAARESAEEARRLLAKLPPKEQEVVRLRFQEGLRYKEIAAATGLTVSHVGVLIHNAMERLRGDLDGADASPIRS